MRVALKVDVLDLQGALEGVPKLLKLFAEHDILASFFLTMGPDSGRGVLQNMFSGREIGHRAAEVYRELEAAGHELGVSAFDVSRWRRQVTRKDEMWTRQQMQKSVQAFESLFGRRPHLFSAAGWQMNSDTPLLEGEMGFRYASDTWGSHPFLPVTAVGTSSCPQIPTTLPSIKDLLKIDGADIGKLHEQIYELSLRPAEPGHVFGLDAGQEGIQGLDVLGRLITLWRRAGQEPVPLHALYEHLDIESLPYHQVGLVRMAGFRRPVAVQISKDNHSPAYTAPYTHIRHSGNRN